MRDQEIIGLYEAYASIYAQEEVEQLDEGRNTSLSALSRESQKRKEDKERGRPETESEKHGRLMLGKFRPGASKEERAEGGRERLKDRGKVPQKGGKDMFEHILEHLVAEGYADTDEAAIAIMANMSEDWREDIIEDIRGAITYNPNTPIGRITKRIKGSTPEKREARTRAYQGNRSDAAERYGASQRNPYDDNRGDIPSLRGR